MTGLLVTAAILATLAAVIWAAPWVANRIVLFMMWCLNRRIAAFNKRQEQRRGEMKLLLQQLEDGMKGRARGGPVSVPAEADRRMLTALSTSCPGSMIPLGVNRLIQESLNRATSMSPEQVDAEYAARRAAYDGKHRA